MENYIICIPSYKRDIICNKKTLATLSKYGIAKERINVFIVEEEKEKYETNLNPEWYGKLIVGAKGLINQREFISNTYPEGSRIISLDDDIDDIDLSLMDYKSLDEFFNTAFEVCEKEEAYIWSVYPVFNPYFRKERKPITTELSYCIGAFFGYINRADDTLKLQITSDNKEDVERSIRYFLKDGKIIRFNKIGFKTKYYGADGGGLGVFKDRLELMKQNAILINQAFPDITKIKIRKNGMYEIKFLNKKVEPKVFAPLFPKVEDSEIQYLPELPESETAVLYHMLSNVSLPLLKNGRGRSKTFGVHRSVTLGFIKGRVSRKYGLSHYSRKYPHIYDEVVRIGKLICPFDFTAIHLNHNVCCPRHIDGNNAGKSVLVSIGEYEGGTLHIEKKGEFDTHNKPLVFDGGKHYHWNNPITSGNKYSFVFFSSSNT